MELGTPSKDLPLRCHQPPPLALTYMSLQCKIGYSWWRLQNANQLKARNETHKTFKED